MELENQLDRLRNRMILEGYSQSGIGPYDRCWIHLKAVAEQNGFSCYSEELALAFLHSRKEKDKNFNKNEKKYKRSIEVIRWFLAEGTIASPVLRSENLSEHFQVILDEYTQWLIGENQSKSSVKTKRSRTRIFLSYLENHHLHAISELTTENLLNFMGSLTLTYTSSYTKGGILYTLRDFLKYCASRYNIESSLPSLIKNIHTNPNESLPSIYTPDEIQIILKSVNRSTNIGKQTFAMLVLFSILGLRSSDIIHLKMSSIHWDKNTIEFHQHKTGSFCQLHMTRSVQIALMEHIKANKLNATQYMNLFLRTRSPIIPFKETSGIYRIVSNCIKQSGININGRSVGPHSLRHSMASRMLTHKIELPVISAALGHTSTKNTSRYLRIDIEQLRTIALEVPL